MNRKALLSKLDALEGRWPGLRNAYLSPEQRVERARSAMIAGRASHADFELVVQPWAREEIRERLLNHSVDVWKAKDIPQSGLAYELVAENRHPRCLAVQIITTAPGNMIPPQKVEQFTVFLDWYRDDEEDYDVWVWAHLFLLVMGDLEALELRREFRRRWRMEIEEK